ncbi:MAG TPA: S9 family peptidase [Gemmatimonadales bacterium]|nr:S9 family peptidase [Gemmatimonadales bacterium]
MSAQPTRTVPSVLPAVSSALNYSQIEEAPPHTGAESGAPVARVSPRVQNVHGETRIDDYFWLRDRSDPEVIAYLEAENSYTAAVMRHTEGLQERLYQEMRGRIKETDLSVPERIDDYFYYTRTEAGGQYSIFCRRHGSLDAPEEVLLDQNPLAAEHTYFKVAVTEVSPDHRFLAYAVDTSGAEEFTLYLKDLTTGELLAETMPGTSPGVAWANDSRTLFYTVLDSARRPCRLYRHTLGTSPSTDFMVYYEPDQSFFLDINRSRSRRYLILDIASHSTSEVRFLDADRPEASFEIVQPRAPGIEYSVTHHDGYFFIVTNDGAPNFRLLRAPVTSPSSANWCAVLPYRPAVKVDGADAFRGHLVIYEREAGLRQIRVLDLASGNEHLIPFPEPVYTVRAHGNPEFDTTLLRFTYTSLVTPSSVVEYDMASRQWTVRKQTEVLGGYDPSLYRSERVFATAPDGERVPVSLVYRAPLHLDGTRPLLLHGYGAYGLSYDPAFSSNILSLLDRGFIVAIAHVRGGEEMGRCWYEGGKLLNKRSTFTDFIACAEHLLSHGYTSSNRLAINGGSAGGLLMGAVANLRPDLFRAVMAEVPFVDVVNTMLDASLPLTVIEYDEWGNPQDSTAYWYIRSYSPYDNIEAKDYPHILVTAGLNDPRVAYWEPAKWTARLRAIKTDANRLLLRVNMGAGHGGASGRFDYLREIAFKYAFMLDVLEAEKDRTEGKDGRGLSSR